MRILIALVLPALALAACSSGKDEPAPAASESVAPLPTTEPGASAAPVATTIPAAVQGRWGLVAADCEAGRADAKGLLTIDGASLKFYESVGKLTAVAEADDSSMRGSFAFTGEGQEWTQDASLMLEDGGKSLVRMEHGANASPTPFKYAKCG